MGFKAKETIYWVVREDWASKGVKTATSYVPIRREDIRMIIDALFDSRNLFDSKQLRMALGRLIDPTAKDDIEKLIAKHIKEREK